MATGTERSVQANGVDICVETFGDVHGSDDPLFPVEHGRALAREIPGAELLVLEQTGHEVPRRVWDVLVPAVLRHTSAG